MFVQMAFLDCICVLLSSFLAYVKFPCIPVRLFIMADWAPWASTLFAHPIVPSSLVTSACLPLILVTSIIISANISVSFSPVNKLFLYNVYPFPCSYSLLLLASVCLSIPPVFSPLCLLNLQNCNDFLVSLN